MTRDLVWGVQVPEVLGEKWAKKVMYVWVSVSFLLLSFRTKTDEEV